MFLFFCFSTGRADDWPQWMGPKRDNIWREEGILEKFPAGGPVVVWKDKKDHGVSPINVQLFLQDGILYGYTETGHMYGVELPSGSWPAGKEVFTAPRANRLAGQDKPYWLSFIDVRNLP